LESQLAELKARLLTHAESLDLHGDIHARSVAMVLHRRHRTSRPDAHRQARLARGLDRHPATAAAMTAGAVRSDQALVVIDGVEALPTDLDPAVRVKAEAHLLELAATWDAKALKGFARTILEVVAPDLADAHLAKQLEASEAEDEEKNRLHLWETSTGRVRFKGDLDGFSGACLQKALFALSAPKSRASKGQPDTGPGGERVPTAERLGRAFADYVRRYPKRRLPQAGGLNATVIVTMTLETLLGGIKAATVDTGEHLSAALARRIAAETNIIPAVLGGPSEVLDLGRSQRFHSKAQRIKATIEQGGCIVEGHGCPPGFTQMHHPVPWAEGGPTDGDGWMLCPPAHRMLDDPAWRHERLPDGTLRFHRRQ
jgi:hypothetical protein